MPRHWACYGIAFSLLCGVGAGAAEELAGTTAADAPTAAALEQLIDRLNDAFDLEHTGQVESGLLALNDPAEQARLQELLNARRQELMRQDAEAAHSQEADLMVQIEELTLGPQASAQDLRRRDELRATINQVADPVLRQTLLERLEQREQLAQ